MPENARTRCAKTNAAHQAAIGCGLPPKSHHTNLNSGWIRVRHWKHLSIWQNTARIKSLVKHLSRMAAALAYQKSTSGFLQRVNLGSQFVQCLQYFPRTAPSFLDTGRICQELSKTDKKNSRQYFLRKSKLQIDVRPR